MKFRKCLILLFLFLACWLVPTCGDDDDDDDDDGDPEPYRPWGDDLPPCDPYVSDFAWFHINEFEEKAEAFVDRFGTDPQACVASVEGGDMEIICDDWSVAMTWQKNSGEFPIQDGGQVHVAATISIGGNWEEITGRSIGIFSEEMEILMFQSDGMEPQATGPLVLEITERKMVCEYVAGQAQPPSSPDDPYSQVVGLSFRGSLNEIGFFISAPQEEALTEDGEYWAILPIHYQGVFDWSGTCSDDCDVNEFLFQVVKK